MEASDSADTMVNTYQTTRRQAPQESNLNEEWRCGELDNNFYVVGRDILQSDLARGWAIEFDPRLVHGLLPPDGSGTHTVFFPSGARGFFPDSKAVQKVSSI
jgi:hypothetical protein